MQAAALEPVARELVYRLCGSEGQCSCVSTRSALALESKVVDGAGGPQERGAAGSGGVLARGSALLPFSLVAAVHAHRTQFSRALREGMQHGATR